MNSAARRWAARNEIRLVKVRLAQREPAESAAVGMHAIGLVADIRSALRPRGWLLDGARG